MATRASQVAATVPAAADSRACTLVADVNRALPRQRVGPLTIHFAVSLAWRAFLPAARADSVNPDVRDGGSLLGVSIWTRALFLQPHFLFPRPWDSAELGAFLTDLDQDCPFRFRDGYFYRLVPNRDGRLTQVRKLPRDWRARTGAAE